MRCERSRRRHATAVEEQGAATQQFAHNVQQAARATQEMSENIAQVRSAPTTTGAAADRLLEASSYLSRSAAELRAARWMNFLPA